MTTESDKEEMPPPEPLHAIPEQRVEKDTSSILIGGLFALVALAIGITIYFFSHCP